MNNQRNLLKYTHTHTYTYAIHIYSHALHNNVLVNNRLHIPWWSFKIITEPKNSYCLISL